ncbi:MAG: helix-turn-helix domain-containing protein [Pseudomonadota bacterium]
MSYRTPHWSQRPPFDHEGTDPSSERSGAKAAQTSAIDPNKLYTTPEVAKIFRMSGRTFERQRVQGDGPPFVKLGNGSRARVVYRGADLIAWIESQIRNSTSDRGR